MAESRQTKSCITKKHTNYSDLICKIFVKFTPEIISSSFQMNSSFWEISQITYIQGNENKILIRRKYKFINECFWIQIIHHIYVRRSKQQHKFVIVPRNQNSIHSLLNGLCAYMNINREAYNFLVINGTNQELFLLHSIALKYRQS